VTSKLFASYKKQEFLWQTFLSQSYWLWCLHYRFLSKRDFFVPIIITKNNAWGNKINGPE